MQNHLKTKLMAVQSGEWYYSLVVLHDVRWGGGGGGGGRGAMCSLYIWTFLLLSFSVILVVVITWLLVAIRFIADGLCCLSFCLGDSGRGGRRPDGDGDVHSWVEGGQGR